MFEIIVNAAILQTLFLSIYFFINRKKKFGFIYQSILLFLSSFGIWIGSLYSSHKILNYPHLSRVGFLILSLLGGFIYLSTKSILKKSNKLKNFDFKFFVIPVFIIIYLIPFYISSIENKILYLKEDLVSIHTDCYIISILIMINNYFSILFSIQLFKKFQINQKNLFNWILFFITIPFVISLFDKNTLNSGIYSISVSILIIIRSYFLFYKMKQNDKQNFLFDTEEKYEKSKINSDTINEIGKKIENYLILKRPYLDSDFQMKDLCNEMNITSSKASQVFSNYFQKNFYFTINKFRVQEFLRIYKDENNKNRNILQIAFEAGFNSKSNFNNSFKKFTGKTPTQYFNSASKLARATNKK